MSRIYCRHVLSVWDDGCNHPDFLLMNCCMQVWIRNHQSHLIVIALKAQAFMYNLLRQLSVWRQYTPSQAALFMPLQSQHFRAITRSPRPSFGSWREGLGLSVSKLKVCIWCAGPYNTGCSDQISWWGVQCQRGSKRQHSCPNHWYGWRRSRCWGRGSYALNWRCVKISCSSCIPWRNSQGPSFLWSQSQAGTNILEIPNLTPALLDFLAKESLWEF